MTEEIAAERGQKLPAAVVGEMRFESRDIGAYFRDAIGELVEDIGEPGRGISWAFTVFRSGDAVTVAAGSAAAQAGDEAQGPFEDSPARTAIRSGEFVLVSDTGVERRWPGYASTAAAAGIRSLLSVPLTPAGVFRAVVTLYAPVPHGFTSADITAAVRFARHTSRNLQLAHQLALTAERSAELSSAQLSRALAGLALRTLVREYGFSSDAALEYLRRVAGNFAVGPLEGSLGVLITGGAQDRSGDAAEALPAESLPAGGALG
jgi:GAF domain-containing protein